MSLDVKIIGLYLSFKLHFIYYVCVQVREEATEVSPSTISPQGRQSALQWRRHTQSNLIQHRLLAFRSYMFA